MKQQAASQKSFCAKWTRGQNAPKRTIYCIADDAPARSRFYEQAVVKGRAGF